VTTREPAPFLVRPGEGRFIPRAQTGGGVTIKVSSELSGGSLTLYECRSAIGGEGRPGPHAHPSFDQVFYVLQGEYEFVAADRCLQAHQGSTVFIPRGVFHDLQSAGGTPGRLLTFCSPGGIEDFFAELAHLESE
jgi:mannose-6-phosphate isomerase-like protein (cupin superfamily)